MSCPAFALLLLFPVAVLCRTDSVFSSVKELTKAAVNMAMHQHEETSAKKSSYRTVTHNLMTAGIRLCGHTFCPAENICVDDRCLPRAVAAKLLAKDPECKDDAPSDPADKE